MLYAVVVERQTRHFEGVVRVTSYGFKSHQPHQKYLIKKVLDKKQNPLYIIQAF